MGVKRRRGWQLVESQSWLSVELWTGTGTESVEYQMSIKGWDEELPVDCFALTRGVAGRPSQEKNRCVRITISFSFLFIRGSDGKIWKV